MKEKLLSEINHYIEILKEIYEFDITYINNYFKSLSDTFQDEKQKALNCLISENNKCLNELTELKENIDTDVQFAIITAYEDNIIATKNKIQNLIKNKASSQLIAAEREKLSAHKLAITEEVNKLKHCASKISKLKSRQKEIVSDYLEWTDTARAKEGKTVVISNPIVISYLGKCFEINSDNSFPNLFRLIYLLGNYSFNGNATYEFEYLSSSKLNTTFSIACQEEFDKLSLTMQRLYLKDTACLETIKNQIISYIELSHAIHRTSKEYTFGQFIKANGNIYYKTVIQILDISFLESCKNFLENLENADLPELLINCLPTFMLVKDNAEVKAIAERFKQLFYETSEQILITEQRYFEQKRLEQQEQQHAEMLEQLEENARLERVRQDRQAELDRQSAEHQAELNRQQQSRLAREQAERDKYLANEQRDRERQQKYEERKNASERCFMCARYSSCSTRGTPGCASFIPK